MAQDEDLVRMEDHEGGGFDVVLRGYDRRQVEDYIQRVELTLGDADRMHREDGDRIHALEEELATAKLALGEAERRASGLPEPASLVGERLATMLRLAEEEAEELVEHAREKAAKSTAERTAELERREQEVATSGVEADRLRLEAQEDAKALRARAQQEADELLREAQAQADEVLAAAQDEAGKRRRTAEEDIEILHDDARAKAAALVADAERQADDLVADAEQRVEELARQRDAIAAQLEELRRSLSTAMKPLGTAE
jgi:cell division septum initiation protein DivIVA